MTSKYVEGHTAYVMDRGGTRRIFQVKNFQYVEWNRVRDAISDATVYLSPESAVRQAEELARIEPGRHELCLFRGQERVWEGPITLTTDEPERFTIDAKDVMHYLNRTAIQKGYSSAYIPGVRTNGDYVIDRIMNIVNTEFAEMETFDPPYNVLPWVVPHQTLTDARTTTVTLPYQMYVFQHIDKLAARSGIDYTVVGRAIHFWDTSKEAMGRTRVVTQNDFLGAVKVSAYGMETATRAIVTDGQGQFATAGGNDVYYGRIDHLADAYDEDEGGPIPTLAELQAQAYRNLWGRNPTPIIVRVPDNSTLDPSSDLSVDQLVPGVYMPLLAKTNVRELSQMQKLSGVKVTETPKGEQIQITLYPTTQPDEE